MQHLNQIQRHKYYGMDHDHDHDHEKLNHYDDKHKTYDQIYCIPYTIWKDLSYIQYANGL